MTTPTPDRSPPPRADHTRLVRELAARDADHGDVVLADRSVAERRVSSGVARVDDAIETAGLPRDAGERLREGR